MRIGIASDPGGYGLDYPDFVIPLAGALAAGEIERGGAPGGSGVGASAAANKFRGVRAGLIQDAFSARQGVVQRRTRHDPDRLE